MICFLYIVRTRFMFFASFSLLLLVTQFYPPQVALTFAKLLSHLVTYNVDQFHSRFTPVVLLRTTTYNLNGNPCTSIKHRSQGTGELDFVPFPNTDWHHWKLNWQEWRDFLSLSLSLSLSFRSITEEGTRFVVWSQPSRHLVPRHPLNS